MNLSPFSDLPFCDEESWDDYQLAHGMAHQKIYDVLYSQSKFFLYHPLFDTPLHDRNWLLDHQQEHQSHFLLLGLTGMPDLITVNFENENEFLDWHLLHAQVHTLINSKLGIV
jgi:hypothetical protein